jgi:hypothetical protein
MDEIEKDNYEMDRQEYLDERRFLAETEINMSKQFDTLLFAITSGVIALSITLITGTDEVLYERYLLISWVILLTSLFMQVRSNITSTRALREEQAILTEWYQDYQSDPRENPYKGLPTFYNRWSLTLSTLGVLLMLIWVIISYEII